MIATLQRAMKYEQREKRYNKAQDCAPHSLYENLWPAFRSIFPTSVRHNAGPHDAKQPADT
jgi:hypothetical protein